MIKLTAYSRITPLFQSYFSLIKSVGLSDQHFPLTEIFQSYFSLIKSSNSSLIYLIFSSSFNPILVWLNRQRDNMSWGTVPLSILF